MDVVIRDEKEKDPILEVWLESNGARGVSLMGKGPGGDRVILDINQDGIFLHTHAAEALGLPSDDVEGRVRVVRQ